MNLSELAQHLDLAISTVSRVLSGNAKKYRISETTARRILAAAEEHNVIPDPLGASLRKGSLGMIGLLVPDITNPFFSHLARSIELELRNANIAVQLCDSSEEVETEARLFQKLLARRLDGLIIAPVGNDTLGLSALIEKAQMPIVVIDRVIPGLQIPSVSLDNAHAGRLAAEHLIKAGHRKIGCLRGSYESQSDQERLKGVEEAMTDAGLKADDLFVAGKGSSRTASLDGARELLDREHRPTAIVTLSGQGILAVLERATALGLSIPGELSVIAFDEQPWSPFMNPPLTTISQPVAEMAGEAVKFLKTALAEKSEVPRADSPANPPQRVLKASICERHSVTAPPGDAVTG
ncbi:LacI family DNA-binding transcriptional regulator [Verrucomicrobiales bacterium BCK34]|nr:LacI family DNA-binding transcriptional regulator [Verrucomicrobiales bacterium BCK34]